MKINDVVHKTKHQIGLVKKNIFIKNVLFISGGTIFAQLIVLLSSPIISRVYSSSDFGLFQQYQAILSFLIVLSGLRYEIAIFLPKEDRDAYSLMLLSLMINIAFSISLLLIIVLLRFFDYRFGFINGLMNFVYFIPFAVFGAAIYQTLNSMIIRKKDFKQIGITRVSQATGMVSGQIVIGYFFDKSIGLIWGDLISKVLGISTFIHALFKQDRNLLLSLNFQRIKSLASEYRKFPMVSVPSGLLNIASITVSTFFIGNFWGLTVLGYYALVDRIFAAPSMLIGQSVSQVYTSEFVELSRSNPNLLLSRFVNLAKKISLIALLPYTLAAIVAPYLFGWIFGNPWSEAGVYFALLAPMQFVGIVVWPLIPTLNLLERQNWQLKWDIFRLVSIVIILAIAHYYKFSPRTSLFCFGTVMLLSYLIHLGLSYLALTLRIKEFNNS